MQKELIADHLSTLPAAFPGPSRIGLHISTEPGVRPGTEPEFAGLEREYLATCQKIEQLVERKQEAAAETIDVAGLHQELSLIGSRIQREPDDRSHEEDYISVLKRVKESLWRKMEADELKGEFQKLHFELLGLGHRLGFDEARAALDPLSEFDGNAEEDMNLGDVERQIADLQAQIRSLHNHQ
jgi:hypothetical protein